MTAEEERYVMEALVMLVKRAESVDRKWKKIFYPVLIVSLVVIAFLGFIYWKAKVVAERIEEKIVLDKEVLEGINEFYRKSGSLWKEVIIERRNGKDVVVCQKTLQGVLVNKEDNEFMYGVQELLWREEKVKVNWELIKKIKGLYVKCYKVSK